VTRIGLFACGAALCLGSGTALASPGDPAAAEALFRAGREHVEAGDWSTAYTMFLASNRLDFALGTLMNLAACEEHIGKVATAWEQYRELLESLPPGDDRRAYVAESVNRLERLVPRLTVFLPVAFAAGVVVTEDDVELRGASLGADLPVDPGDHSVAVIAPGHVVRRYSVRLDAGQRLTVKAELGDPTLADQVLDQVLIGRAASKRTAAAILGGVGLGALTVGAILGAHALSERSSSDALCTKGVCSDQAALNMYDAAKSAAVGADIALAVGAVSLGIATYLFATSMTAAQGRTVAAIGITPSGIRFAW
jgi:hypothetical protein